jgi:prolyl-tRNA synthetase, family II
MVLAETGEDTLVICESCSYAANVEKAAIALAEAAPSMEVLRELVKVETPGMKKVDKVAEFLKVEPAAVIKTLFYLADGVVVAALVRGDREVQSVKLKNLLGATDVEPLDEEQIWQQTRLPVGYLGPVGLELKMVADQEVMRMVNAVAGANEKGCHLTGVNPGRDFTPDVVGDLRQITVNDRCPVCGGGLRLKEGIEVGHIFKLGTKYSEAMKANFQDSDGQEKPFVMGCYGIGVSRVVAAAIEQNHDAKGIIFPVPLAPFQVIVLNLGPKDEGYCTAAEDLYTQLRAQGLDVLLDDRDERPGSKFADADLLGIPYRLTVGKTFEKEGKWRSVPARPGKRSPLPGGGDGISRRTRSPGSFLIPGARLHRLETA